MDERGQCALAPKLIRAGNLPALHLNSTLISFRNALINVCVNVGITFIIFKQYEKNILKQCEKISFNFQLSLLTFFRIGGRYCFI